MIYLLQYQGGPQHLMKLGQTPITIVPYLLGRCYHLTSIELWSAYFDLETYTAVNTVHQQIPLLLTKSALSCWMHPIAQTILSRTPSHSWVPPE